MATRTGLVRHNSPHTRAAVANPLDVLARVTESIRHHLLARISARRTRAHLGMLGVPLAIAVALMSGYWWAIFPLTACAWWWAPRDWGWEWLDAVGRGVIATEWAYMGAGALAFFPDDRLAVAVAWVALPAALAVYAARRKGGDR